MCKYIEEYNELMTFVAKSLNSCQFIITLVQEYKTSFFVLKQIPNTILFFI